MQIETTFISNSVGRLEVLRGKSEGQAEGAILILHPNPSQGGSNRNKVIQTLFKRALKSNYNAYAPNFRGVGQSEGTFDQGQGEQEDAALVWELMEKENSTVPLVIAGFSLGGYIASLLANKYLPRAAILIGAAVAHYPKVASPLPKDTLSLIIHGEQDEVVSLQSVEDWARPQGRAMTLFLETSHFMHGKLILLEQTVALFLQGLKAIE